VRRGRALIFLSENFYNDARGRRERERGGQEGNWVGRKSRKVKEGGKLGREKDSSSLRQSVRHSAGINRSRLYSDASEGGRNEGNIFHSFPIVLSAGEPGHLLLLLVRSYRVFRIFPYMMLRFLAVTNGIGRHCGVLFFSFRHSISAKGKEGSSWKLHRYGIETTNKI